MKIDTVDLFCGIGGMSLGFQNAGFNIKTAYDRWDKAVFMYNENFDHPAIERDLSDDIGMANEIAALEPDMIIGGPPCQDFSAAGKRSEGSRADLTASFANIVASVKPVWFVMENVDPAPHSIAYQGARETLKRAGYGLTETVLDASLCGCPQKRKRFFCIGKLGEKDKFLDALIAAGQRKSPMTPREYLDDEFGIDHYYRHPRTYARRGVYSMDEPSPTVRGVNRPMPPNYKFHTGDTVKDRVRCLTTKERSRLQTFPPDFKLNGSKTDLEQMIGNAVPVELAKYVGKAIMTYIKTPVTDNDELFS